jgi:hypothetical protein
VKEEWFAVSKLGLNRFIEKSGTKQATCTPFPALILTKTQNLKYATTQSKQNTIL